MESVAIAIVIVAIAAVVYAVKKTSNSKGHHSDGGTIGKQQKK